MAKAILSLLTIAGTIALYIFRKWADPRYEARKKEERKENESQEFRKALKGRDADMVSRLLHDRLRRRGL